MYTTYKPQNSFGMQEQYPPVMQSPHYTPGAQYQPPMYWYQPPMQYQPHMHQPHMHQPHMQNQPNFEVTGSRWSHLLDSLDRSRIDGNSPDYVQIPEKPYFVEGRGDRSETVSSATESISAAPKQDTKIKIILEHHLREIKEALSDIKRMLATHQNRRNQLTGVVDVAQ